MLRENVGSRKANTISAQLSTLASNLLSGELSDGKSIVKLGAAVPPPETKGSDDETELTPQEELELGSFGECTGGAARADIPRAAGFLGRVWTKLHVKICGAPEGVSDDFGLELLFKQIFAALKDPALVMIVLNDLCSEVQAASRDVRCIEGYSYVDVLRIVRGLWNKSVRTRVARVHAAKGGAAAAKEAAEASNADLRLKLDAMQKDMRQLQQNSPGKHGGGQYSGGGRGGGDKPNAKSRRGEAREEKRKRYLEEHGGEDEAEPVPKKTVTPQPSPQGEEKHPKGLKKVTFTGPNFDQLLVKVKDGSLDKITGKDSLMSLWGAACVQHCPCEWDKRPCGFPPIFGACSFVGCDLCKNSTDLPENVDEIVGLLKAKVTKAKAEKFVG